MADIALTPDQIGSIVQYVAPGFFARVAYEARFPQPERSALTVLVWSVAASLPLVALANVFAGWLGIEPAPTNWKYVLMLLIPSALIGYGLAVVRSAHWARVALGYLGLRHQPDGSLYAMTMLGLPRAATISIELQDGRIVSGTPELARRMQKTTSMNWSSRTPRGRQRLTGRMRAPGRPS
jgi:hypothetical protein